MPDKGLNPYAPPTPESSDHGPVGPLDSLSGPISFQGSLSKEDLHEYLRNHEHVGCVFLFVLVLVVGYFVFVIPVALFGRLSTVSFGGLGLTITAAITSLVSYRRMMFAAANPNWQQPLRGELRRDGILIDRDGAETFFRWDWFERVVSTPRIAALVPSLPNHPPVLLTPPMFSHSGDWAHVAVLHQSVGVASDKNVTSQTRRYDNEAMLRNRRQRSVEVPPEAIGFEGFVTRGDLNSLPKSWRRRLRPARVYLVITAVLVSLSLILVEILQMVQARAMLAILLVFFGGVMIFRLAARRLRKTQTDDRVVVYLTAFAAEPGITSDYGIVATTVPWKRMHCAAETDRSVVLIRTDVRQFIVAKADMFAGEQNWQNFKALVKGKMDRSNG